MAYRTYTSDPGSVPNGAVKVEIEADDPSGDPVGVLLYQVQIADEDVATLDAWSSGVTAAQVASGPGIDIPTRTYPGQDLARCRTEIETLRSIALGAGSALRQSLTDQADLIESLLPSPPA